MKSLVIPPERHEEFGFANWLFVKAYAACKDPLDYLENITSLLADCDVYDWAERDAIDAFIAMIVTSQTSDTRFGYEALVRTLANEIGPNCRGLEDVSKDGVLWITPAEVGDISDDMKTRYNEMFQLALEDAKNFLQAGTPA